MWTRVWPCTLLVRLGSTSSTYVAKGRRALHRAPRDANLTIWALHYVSLPTLLRVHRFFGARAECHYTS